MISNKWMREFISSRKVGYSIIYWTHIHKNMKISTYKSHLRIFILTNQLFIHLLSKTISSGLGGDFPNTVRHKGGRYVLSWTKGDKNGCLTQQYENLKRNRLSTLYVIKIERTEINTQQTYRRVFKFTVYIRKFTQQTSTEKKIKSPSKLVKGAILNKLITPIIGE